MMNLIRVIWRTRVGVKFPQSFIDLVKHQIATCQERKLITGASCDRLTRLIAEGEKEEISSWPRWSRVMERVFRGGDDGAQ
jgi:hypothetical protein